MSKWCTGESDVENCGAACRAGQGWSNGTNGGEEDFAGLSTRQTFKHSRNFERVSRRGCSGSQKAGGLDLSVFETAVLRPKIIRSGGLGLHCSPCVPQTGSR